MLIAVAVLLLVGVAGWLAWRSAGDAENASERAGLAPASSTSPERAKGSDSAGHGSPSRPGATGGENSPRNKGDRPLSGKVIVLDPGHNINNKHHTVQINRLVNVGAFRKECDTTGTSTNDGYAEASFTLDVARRTVEILRDKGATVRLTHHGERPFGPCVDERAKIGNAAHADAAVSIHADGSAPSSHGFHVIAPAAIHSGDADTRAIADPSRRLGEQLKRHFAEATGQPVANYVGNGSGMTVRRDLGGLNLSTVPKVFVECGNMRNSEEAKNLKRAQWRQRAAEGIAEGISAFLASTH